MHHLQLTGIVALTAVVLLLGCSAEDDAPPEKPVRSSVEWAAQLGPPEEFTWDDQPISFVPPPADWERQREQSGGLMGARFVKYVSGGQAIHFAEFTAVGQRDRCSELEALLRELDELSQGDFLNGLRRARPYLKEPINRSEAMTFEAANERLDRASEAYRAGDMLEVRSRISAALWDLRFVSYSLEEVVAPALFTGEGYENFGKLAIFEPQDGEVAGQPSLVLDYLLDVSEKELIYGRKVYVEHNNRLFEASFQGVKEYLPLFEAMVASISFPKGPCEH